MNVVGIAATILFVAGFLGAVVSALVFDVAGLVKAHSGRPFGIWSDASARKRFLIFVAFCALGPISVLLGFIFGGWPT
jgi:hypothetical protein